MPNISDDLTKVLAVAAVGLAAITLLVARRAHAGPGVLARSRSREWFRLGPVPADETDPVPGLEVEHA